MKILYISTVFPEPQKSSTIYTDLIEELNSREHEIYVVASEYKRNIKKTCLTKERGVNVLRVKTGSLYDINFVKKGISVVTLKFHLINAIKKYLKNQEFDLILFESPPITLVDVVGWAMKYFNCPSYLMLKDIFPQNAVDIGIINKNGIIYNYFRLKRKKLYKVATQIGCMSQGNKEYILNHNSWIDKNKIVVFPNTKKISFNGLKSNEYEMRKKYNIPVNSVVAVYGGNMGKPQGLDFFMEIMDKCSDREDIFFLLVGRGTERQKIKDFMRRRCIKNAMLIDNLPRNDYEKLIQECDIGLIFLDYRFTIPNYPSRILSYFEYSLPVLAATDKNSDFKDMIQESNSGFWIEAGNIEKFIEKLDLLIKDKQLRFEMGKCGRQYLEQNFNVTISANLLEEHYEIIKNIKAMEE